MYDAINQATRHYDDWDYFTYINDDDILFPSFSSHLKNVRLCNPDISYGMVSMIDTNGRQLYRLPAWKNPNTLNRCWRAGISPFTQQGTLVSKAAYDINQGFALKYKLASDMDFWVRLSCDENTRFFFYNKLVAGYRITDGQLSQNRSLMIQEKNKILTNQFTTSKPQRYISSRLILFAMNFKSYSKRFLFHGLKRSEGFFN
tara:strand:+ start:7835 stop:8440 length:606 start_codon:yes stop_codon:yes gene_type:complete